MSKIEKSKKATEIVEKSLQDLSELVNVDNIVGKAISTKSGFQIIPVSKVTLGHLAGGGEYGEIKTLKDNECYPFAGGSGAVVSIKPSIFIVDDGKTCRLLKATEEPLETLIDKTSELINKFIQNDNKNN